MYTEKQAITEALALYADHLGNQVCNDYLIQDTPENRAFVERFNVWCKKANPVNPPLLEFRNGKAIGYDWLIVAYLKDWIQNDHQ